MHGTNLAIIIQLNRSSQCYIKVCFKLKQEIVRRTLDKNYRQAIPKHYNLSAVDIMSMVIIAVVEYPDSNFSGFWIKYQWFSLAGTNNSG
jgi:hypothetical protein